MRFQPSQPAAGLEHAAKRSRWAEGAEPRANHRPASPLSANRKAPRPALPEASHAPQLFGAAPSPAEWNRTGAERAEPGRVAPNRTERSRTGAKRLGAAWVLGAAAAAARPDKDLEHMDEQLVTGDPSSVTPQFVAPPEAAGKDIIPVYCSLLAAVVVGLLAYVAFKCWHTCRQKQQLAKARAGDVGTAPEGEKLHSDSGVCLDTHSLQEPHQPGKAPRPEAHPLSGLSPQRQEEVEQLLEAGGAGGDWRSLAASLGFSPDAIGTFGRGRAPARTLLSAWAASEGATVDALCQALAAIGRQDVAQRLVAPGDATSVV